jgi:type IV fimbrial biogenesis protein FimT
MTRACRGVTLIELLISVALGFILIMLAIPAYNSWTADAEVSSAASMLADGMRAARVEAIKQNTSVEFVVSPSGWDARFASSGTSITGGTFQEGAKRATVNPQPGGTSIVTFNGLGGSEIKNADATDPVEWIDVNVTGSSRPLRVIRGANSTGIRVCDPKFSWPSDPKGCP